MTNEVQSLVAAQGSAIRSRVWCSPQAHKYPYVWEWAVDEGKHALEFGREPTETEAKREAAEAVLSWQNILESVPSVTTGQAVDDAQGRSSPAQAVINTSLQSSPNGSLTPPPLS